MFVITPAAVAFQGVDQSNILHCFKLIYSWIFSFSFPFIRLFFHKFKFSCETSWTCLYLMGFFLLLGCCFTNSHFYVTLISPSAGLVSLKTDTWFKWVICLGGCCVYRITCIINIVQKRNYKWITISAFISHGLILLHCMLYKFALTKHAHYGSPAHSPGWLIVYCVSEVDWWGSIKWFVQEYSINTKKVLRVKSYWACCYCSFPSLSSTCLSFSMCR